MCDQFINNMIEKEELYKISGWKLLIANAKGVATQILVNVAKEAVGGMFTKK